MKRMKLGIRMIISVIDLRVLVYQSKVESNNGKERLKRNRKWNDGLPQDGLNTLSWSFVRPFPY